MTTRRIAIATGIAIIVAVVVLFFFGPISYWFKLSIAKVEELITGKPATINIGIANLIEGTIGKLSFVRKALCNLNKSICTLDIYVQPNTMYNITMKSITRLIKHGIVDLVFMIGSRPRKGQEYEFYIVKPRGVRIINILCDISSIQIGGSNYLGCVQSGIIYPNGTQKVFWKCKWKYDENITNLTLIIHAVAKCYRDYDVWTITINNTWRVHVVFNGTHKIVKVGPIKILFIPGKRFTWLLPGVLFLGNVSQIQNSRISFMIRQR